MNKFPSFSTFNVEPFLAHWAKFYQKIYGLAHDPSNNVILPSVDQALGAGLVMIPGVTIEHDLAAIKKMTKSGQLYRYTDSNIDGLIQRDKEALRPSGPYGLWTAPTLKATNQASHLAEKSYNDLVGMNLLSQVMNFAEYTRFFCWFMWATKGNVLDRKNITLTGSLDSDDGVLSGGWCDGRFYVDWDLCDDAHDHIRFRQVVLPPLS